MQRMKNVSVVVSLVALVCLLPYAGAQPDEAEGPSFDVRTFLAAEGDGQSSLPAEEVDVGERWCGGKVDADCDICLRWGPKYKVGPFKFGRECVEWKHCTLYTNVHSAVSEPKCHNTPGDFIDPVVL